MFQIEDEARGESEAHTTRIAYEMAQLRLAGRYVERVNETTILVSTSLKDKELLLVEFLPSYPFCAPRCDLSLEVVWPSGTCGNIFDHTEWSPGIHMDGVLCAVEAGKTRVTDVEELYDKKRK